MARNTGVFTNLAEGVRHAPVAVVAVETWPAIPGHAGATRMWSGRRLAITRDGRYWLVRRRGIFTRAQWLPERGMFIRLRETMSPKEASQ